MEEVPIEIPETIGNKYQEDLFINNVKNFPDRRYSVKLPFINGENQVLGDSKYIALRRFHNSERKLEKKADLKKTYYETFSDYLKKGENLAKNSPLLSLMDKEGLLRVGGRLENITLSYREKHPIILSSKSLQI